MAAVQAQQSTIGQKVSNYEKQLSQLAQIRSTLQQTARATGDWSTETFRTVSATQKLTQSLVDQKLGAREAFRAWKQGYFKQMINEQHSLRNSFATQMTGSGFGKSTVDLYAPKGVAKSIRSWTTEIGVYSQAMRSVSQQTINWGKNTQWAGRQMMVGLTVPLGIAAVGMAKQAYEVDKQLTRIAKVYDTQSTIGLQGTERQAAAERELSQLRADSLAVATTAARTYGAAVKDTLDVESQLAATGLHGGELTKATTEVVRIATLGELEYQSAIDTTVALQTAFKLSNEGLTESFNMMNAVENATSLTIQDIAEAVPRAASAMSALGGTVEDMTVMLVAMRESGVDPAIAANAIKSATSALLDPTKEAIDYWKQTFGVDLPAIVEKAGGNVYKIIQQMAKSTQGFDPLEIQKGINNTFGRYQFDRISGLFTNIGDAMNGFQNQTLKAMETVGMSTEDLANIADTEMQRMQQSISGRFQRAVESMKASFIPLGMTVLDFITPMVEGVKNLVDWFNELGGTNKKILLWTLAIMGMAGPLVMITGIFGNLLGHAMKLPAMLGGMVARFRPMTGQMAANELVAKRAAMTWDTQTSSAAMLTQSITTLTAAMEANAVAQGHMLSGNGTLFLGGQGSGKTLFRSEGGQVRKRTVPLPGQSGKVKEHAASKAEYAIFDAAEAAAAEKASVGIAQNSERTKMSWGQIAGAMGGVAMAAGAFMTMDLSSASIGENLMTAAMFASSFSMIIPSFKGASGFASKIANALGGNKFAAMGKHMGEMVTYGGTFVNQTAKAGGLVSRLGGGMAKVGAALTRILPMALRFFGPIGLIAGGLTLIVTMYNKMTEMARRQKEINDSAEDWANILGYVENAGAFNGEVVDNTASRIDDVNALKEANEGLVESLVDAKKAGGDFGHLYDLALREALKVVTSGGTADQAKRAFEVALQASGINEPEMKNLILKFETVDLADPEGVRNQIQDQIQAILNDQPIDIEAKGAWWNLGLGGNIDKVFGDGLNDDASKAALEAGRMFASSFNSASGDLMAQTELFNGMKSDAEKAFLGPYKRALADMPKATQDALSEAGITGIDSFARAVQKKDPTAVLSLAFHSGDEMASLMEDYTSWVNEFLTAFGKAAGMSDDEIDSLLDDTNNNLASIAANRKADLMSLEDAQVGYNMAMQDATSKGQKLTEVEKLALLNIWRKKSGLDAATSSTQGFGDAAQSAAGDVDVLAEATENAAADASNYANAMKRAMQGAWQGIFKEADDALESANNAEIDGIQRRGEATQKGLEKRSDALEKAFDAEEEALGNHWDNLEKMEEASYDNQIKAVEDSAEARVSAIEAAIQAEEDADDRRQRIFEAEQRRLQRLAEMANRNIDFNSALNSGNLDEAAKILNSASSQTSQWAIDDAQMTAEEQSENRRKGMEAQVTSIESERDTRVAAIEDARDARLEALKTERQEEEKALEARKKTAQEEIRLAQEVARESTQAAIENSKAKQEADRKALEMELAALREFVPQNEADLQAHIGRVQAAYDKYGHGLQISGDQWSSIIGDELSRNIAIAAQGLQNDINWQAIGTYISDNIGKGTGMTAAQVTEFLRTGKFPEGPQQSATAWAPTVTAPRGGTGGTQRAYHGGGLVRHSGGKIGFSARERTGIPRGASLYPSEVPTVLKKGEFVVDSQGTKHNQDLLERINGSSKSLMSYEGVKHTGGMMDSVGMLPGLYGAAIAKIHELVGMQKVKNAQAAASSSGDGGSFGMGPMGGGDAGSGVFRTTKGGWPPARSGVVSANTAAAVQYVKQRWGLKSIGTLGSRPNKSDHPMGKALDNMIPNYKSPQGIAQGNDIAKFFIENPNMFGTKYVIWRDRIAENNGRGWQKYTHPLGANNSDTLQHRDHVHASLLHKGGLAGKNGFSAPQLDVGGKVMYDNTLANLHKNETMLTAPLSRDLESGIRNLDLNRANEYNVEVHFNGPVNSDLDIKKAMWAAIEERESKNGKTRKVTLT